jgi:hypothetical protein
MLYLLTSVVSTSDWLRISLVYCHLLLCAFAITAVLKTDLKIVLGKFTRAEVSRAAAGISWLLAGLWASGLAIIYIDTGFSPEVLATKSKLLLKLLCVVTLTLNGMVLHKMSFPVLVRGADSITLKESVLLVVTGALSTSHWMLAAFVGLSQPLGKLPTETLLASYGVFVSAVIITSLFFIPLLSCFPKADAMSRSRESTGVKLIAN